MMTAHHTERHAEKPQRKPLDARLQHPKLWRGGDLRAVGDTAATSTGFASLDALLPGGGWPEAALCELLLPTAGIGELKLLAPALRTLSRQYRWIAWIKPPFIPYAPALSALGIDISKILLIHPRTHEDALWALERATRSGTCSATLAWLSEPRLRLKDTRRLQVAAKQGNTLCCLFRPEQAAEHASTAELRVKLAPQESGDLQLSLIKRRGGWPVSDLHLALEARPKTDVIREQLSLWSDLQSARQGRNTGPRTGLPRTGLPQAGPQMDLQEQTRDSWFFDDELSSSQASSSAPSPAGSSVHSPVQVTH